MATRYMQIKTVPYFVKEHQHSAASSAGSLKPFLSVVRNEKCLVMWVKWPHRWPKQTEWIICNKTPFQATFNLLEGGGGYISVPPHVSTFLMRRHESFYPQTALGFLFSWCKQNCWLFLLSFPILTRPHYPWATHKYTVEGKVFPGDVAPEACCHSKSDCWFFHHAFVVWSCELCLCSFFFYCVDIT